MNTETYTYLLANPQNVNQEHLTGLTTVVEKYPWFQSARALQLKGLKNENSFLYNDTLKVTAAHTTDRNILFEYITSERFVQNAISDHILQHDASVMEIEVTPEDVSEQVSLAIDTQLKAEIRKAEAILNPELFERKETFVQQLVANDTEPMSETMGHEEREVPSPGSQPPEETLALNKPLGFTKDDLHSFGEWLKLTRATPIVRSSKENGQEETKPLGKEQKFRLIDKFIQEKPKIHSDEIVLKKTEKKNLAKPFTKTQDALMTETLAKVYLQQKNYKKAVQAYKILILKYPEKSGFFADQIRAIEKLINTEEL